MYGLIFGTLQVSKSCLQLLASMLRPSPEARPSVADIRGHAWFVENLPSGAEAMNAYYVRAPELTPAVSIGHAVRKWLVPASFPTQVVPNASTIDPCKACTFCLCSPFSALGSTDSYDRGGLGIPVTGTL